MNYGVISDTHMRGLQELSDRIKSGAAQVKVGVPKGPVAMERVGDKIASTGTPLALVAATHEFGAPEVGIPERSFLRAMIHDSANREYFKQINGQSLKACLHGQMDETQALTRLGVAAVGRVQQQIRNGEYEPLKQATIDRKGSSKPLIDTAQLIQSISFELPEASV